MGAMGSCSRKVTVPVERVEVVRDTVRITARETDSRVIRDSVFLSVKGDTVVKESWRWRERERVVRDTLERIIYVNEKMRDEVRQERAPWRKNAGWLVAGVILAAIVVVILNLLKR